MNSYRHLEDLDFASVVGKVGSLRGAARQLGISHSTLSRRLSQLEARLGHAVFIRQKRRLVILPAAHKLLALPNLDSAHHESQPKALPVSQLTLDWFPLLADQLAAARNRSACLASYPSPHDQAWIRLIADPKQRSMGRLIEPIGEMLWGVLVHPALRYDIRLEHLFVPRFAPCPPRSWATLKVKQQIHLERASDGLRAINAHQGLCWLPLNTGLWFSDLVEASTEPERAVQPVYLEYHEALNDDPASKQFLQTLSNNLRKTLAQCRAQCL